MRHANLVRWVVITVAAIAGLFGSKAAFAEATTSASLAAELDSMCRRILVQAKKKFTIVSSGITREFIVLSPKRDCGSKQPVIFVFHGGGGVADEAESVSPFADQARQNPSIVVYPNAIEKSWNDGRINAEGELISKSDDVQFVRDLLALFAGTGKADMSRVYSTGHSNGGTLTLRLACELADKFAAFVSNAAALPVALRDSCSPARPVSLLMVNGTLDTFMPYEGGMGSSPTSQGLNLGARMSVEDTLALFRNASNCSASPTVASVSDRDRLYGGRAQAQCNPFPNQATRNELNKADPRTMYGQCAQNASVELIRVEGGGHTWPSNEQSCFPLLKTGNLTVDFDMSEVAMTFFKRFRLP